MEDRLSVLEQHVATMTVDLAVVRSNYATKQDIADLRAETAAAIAKLRLEMNTLFWRLVTWMTSAMALMTGGVYFIARYVH